MELLIIFSFVVIVTSVFILIQDKKRYIKSINKEIKRVEAANYKNSQEYTQHKKKIEELGLVEASVNQLFSMKQKAMKKLNVPNSFFLNEKIYNSEKKYLLKFALAHGYDNSENIDAIDEKINGLMGYSLEDLAKVKVVVDS
ncbi:MAG: hypothetical protein OQK48_03085 [Sulfurimonas sp.]|uniref:hypothetical protein n=1 Tax=Sulfurimonas sp. TaxID=2022749 RepID=UPI00262FB241|nr:hypothetical protein [Sulfurimonas sp.]MCW8895684.1 hypothetical protein [Sulfurimonas sp.]MCW8953906.1 hypothetical protein [Sulfurimonas sp.]